MRLTRMAGALSIALLAGTCAFSAQVPPDPANPNETVADNFTPPPYGDVIDLATAKKSQIPALWSVRIWLTSCGPDRSSARRRCPGFTLCT